jgi:hypothetical protein
VRPDAKKVTNEAGQRVQKDSGPDSWQFWGPQRQLLNAEKQGELLVRSPAPVLHRSTTCAYIQRMLLSCGCDAC